MREKGGVSVCRDVHAGGSCACCGGQITEVGHVAEIVEGSVERLTKVYIQVDASLKRMMAELAKERIGKRW